MVSKSQLLALLPEPTLRKKEVAERQDVPLIMELVVDKHQEYSPHYDRICELFWRGSAKKTAKALFDFCRSNMKYVAESTKSQTVRSPAAILKTATSWGVDCKHYASFIAGVLDALKRKGKEIEWSYLFVSYSPTDKTPEHVFIVLSENGEDYFVDPVLQEFDMRFPKFYYFHTKKPNMLYSVNGIPGRVGAIEMVRDGKDYTAPMYVTSSGSIHTMQATSTGSPGGELAPTETNSGSEKTFIQRNWPLLAIAAVAAFLIFRKK